MSGNGEKVCRRHPGMYVCGSSIRKHRRCDKVNGSGIEVSSEKKNGGKCSAVSEFTYSRESMVMLGIRKLKFETLVA